MKTFPLKTCLRYPGGKSKATKTLSPWFPEDFKEYREPFIGGGSVAFYATQAYPDVPVWINDKYVTLYNFWVQLRDHGEELSDRLNDIKSEASNYESQDDKDAAHKELFDKTRDEINSQDGLDRAVSFFVLNKCSFSGLTENSTFSKTAARSNFSFIGIQKLKQYSQLTKKWKITNIDYSEVMNAPGEDVFVFLDPPYMINSYLYGTDAGLHKGFDHNLFADKCKICPHNWMVTYNVKDEIENMFEGFHQRNFKITYGMQHRRNNRKNELLITNYDVEPPTPIDLLYA